MLSFDLLSLLPLLPQPERGQPVSGVVTTSEPPSLHQVGLSSLKGQGGRMLPQAELDRRGWHLLTLLPPYPTQPLPICFPDTLIWGFWGLWVPLLSFPTHQM